VTAFMVLCCAVLYCAVLYCTVFSVVNRRQQLSVSFWQYCALTTSALQPAVTNIVNRVSNSFPWC
jgi:cell shape-determining protein MreC